MSKREKVTKPRPLNSLKRSARCHFYQHALQDRSLPIFPVRKIEAQSFDYTKILAEGFHEPLVITGNTERFGIVIPPRETTDMQFIAKCAGPELPVRLIEVGEQAEIAGYSLQQYADYLTTNIASNDESAHAKILNMISLEFSGTPLSNEVSCPSFVNRIDWVRSIWPTERLSRQDYPRVQKYCLAGMAGSYTDFHIDFGGTSVWYHILRGAKRFYLIPPTAKNLRTYEQWTMTPDQCSVFLGDLLPGQCSVLDLSIDETLLLPRLDLIIPA